MIRLGRFEISFPVLGYFRLDGGAMFGAVPKNLWERKIQSDSENCIPLAARSMLIRDGKRNVLVDVGLGEKWSGKEKKIFNIKSTSPDSWDFRPEEITDIILTHLHFDHGGGISRWTDETETKVKLCYPEARVFLQEDNYRNAKSPNLREKASYRSENVMPLKDAKLSLIKGRCEIYPGIVVVQADGHTKGQQYVEVKDDGKLLMFATDLIPTSHHLPLPYNMGYDINSGKLMEEKEEFLLKAIKNDATVVFQHDLEISAAKIKGTERGSFVVREKIA